jgi:hypothetical protein
MTDNVKNNLINEVDQAPSETPHEETPTPRLYGLPANCCVIFHQDADFRHVPVTLGMIA